MSFKNILPGWMGKKTKAKNPGLPTLSPWSSTDSLEAPEAVYGSPHILFHRKHFRTSDRLHSDTMPELKVFYDSVILHPDVEPINKAALGELESWLLHTADFSHLDSVRANQAKLRKAWEVIGPEMMEREPDCVRADPLERGIPFQEVLHRIIPTAASGQAMMLLWRDATAVDHDASSKMMKFQEEQIERGMATFASSESKTIAYDDDAGSSDNKVNEEKQKVAEKKVKACLSIIMAHPCIILLQQPEFQAAVEAEEDSPSKTITMAGINHTRSSNYSPMTWPKYEDFLAGLNFGFIRKRKREAFRETYGTHRCFDQLRRLEKNVHILAQISSFLNETTVTYLQSDAVFEREEKIKEGRGKCPSDLARMVVRISHALWHKRTEGYIYRGHDMLSFYDNKQFQDLYDYTEI